MGNTKFFVKLRFLGGGGGSQLDLLQKYYVILDINVKQWSNSIEVPNHLITGNSTAIYMSDEVRKTAGQRYLE